MQANEIRAKFIEFFKGRGHTVIPSASLVPENDSTTLFTGSGMQPLIPYLLGEKHPGGARLVNSQKSFRALDIEEVGDNRHTTFFEMLGNWSLGDSASPDGIGQGGYFKREQLPWFFEFLTKICRLDPQKLYVTVFAGDQKNNIPKDIESAAIWKEIFAEVGIAATEVELVTQERASQKGMQGGRIFYYDASKNWWSRVGVPSAMPAGEPGGPDSEVFYDFGTPHNVQYGEHCHPNCDCGRFMEIGNSVFMEYKKTESGTFELLAQKNVDFGGGLERITAAANNNNDVFQIDLFIGSIKKIQDASSYKYGNEHDQSFRIIADHIRGMAFILSEGVAPSNTERGYIVRRLIRRAVRHADLLAMQEDNLQGIVDTVVEKYGEIYPEVVQKQDLIKSKISEEEAKFRKTLKKGLAELTKLKDFSGKSLFNIYSTYGIPLDISLEELEKQGTKLERKHVTRGFDEEFVKHRDLSRTSTTGVFKGGLADHSERTTRLHTATHLLQAGLRHVLGPQLFQKGSHVTAERTRFDFNHPRRATAAELKSVEDWVNAQVRCDLPMKREWMTPKEAHDSGAIGLFDEKYEDKVSIYTIYDPKTNEIISREFCGGPHVEHTGLVGKFKILKEEAVAAGVRRIKATVE